MNVEFEVKLIEALDALDRGETADAILARYPEVADDLRPLLHTATALPALRMQPSEAQKMKSRQAFLKQGAALRQTTQRRSQFAFVPRLAALFGALSVALAVLGGGAVAASGSALPGDPLYGLKRTVESARLTLSGDAARTALQAQFEAQRRAEATALLKAGREVEVQFTGQIESLQPDAWVVGGLVVRVDARTQISGQPQLDRLADVRGLTGRDGLRALSITLDQSVTPVTPEPTPSPSETPTPTITPNTIATLEPTEPRPTRQPPTPTPVPTTTPVPAPVSIEFTGSVNSQTAESWIIDGATVAIDANTVFKGNIGVGQQVKVQALRYASGRLLATHIELLSDDDGGQNTNQNGNQNEDNQNGNDNHDENDNENHNDNEDDNHNDNDNHNENDNHD